MTSTDPYPLALRLTGRRVVVVGGGPVAARRAADLVAAGADVEVVAPQICEDLAALRAAGRVVHHAREFRPTDLDDAWLVHTATGDPDVDAEVADGAEHRRLWCVRADDAAASAAWTPAVAREDGVVISVTSGDPTRSARIRNAVASGLATGTLGVRPGRRSGQETGRVDIIGGGPGDDGLITARGRRLLSLADVVVVDRLAPRGVLAQLDDDVEIIDVGKTPGNHPVPQAKINEILVQRAAGGARVVRLKGGDPFVLGRGGEEVLACREAGVEVAVVPGVTSAIAVPAAEGIPVTHRGVSAGFSVVTGHDERDWSALASVNHTLVLLMGVSRLAETAKSLIEHGRDPQTPACLVEDGYGPRQRRVTASLQDIAAEARRYDVQPPAVLVIGDVVSLADDLSPAPTPSRGVVLTSHGSRDPRAAQVARCLARALATRLDDTEVVHAQLDHEGPRPGAAAQDLLTRVDHVAVAPLLFSTAYHVTTDLPESLAGTTLAEGQTLRTAEALLPDSRLLDAVQQRLDEVWTDSEPPDGLVLACAGTSSPTAAEQLADFAGVWGRQVGVPAAIGHASGPHQSVTDAVALLREQGCRRIGVGLLFVADGLLGAQAREAALQAGARAVGAPIGCLPELVDVLTDRVLATQPGEPSRA